MIDTQSFEKKIKFVSNTNIEIGETSVFAFMEKMLSDRRDPQLLLGVVLGAVNGLIENNPKQLMNKINTPVELTQKIDKSETFQIAYTVGEIIAGKEINCSFNPEKLTIYNEQLYNQKKPNGKITDYPFHESFPSPYLLKKGLDSKELLDLFTTFIAGFISRIYHIPRESSIFEKFTNQHISLWTSEKSNAFGSGYSFANQVSNFLQSTPQILHQISSRIDLFTKFLEGIAGQRSQIYDMIWNVGRKYSREGLYASLSSDEQAWIFPIPLSEIRKFLNDPKKTEDFFSGFADGLKSSTFHQRFYSSYSCEANLGRNIAYKNYRGAPVMPGGYTLGPPPPISIFDLLYNIAEADRIDLLLAFLAGVADRKLQMNSLEKRVTNAGMEYRNCLLSNRTYHHPEGEQDIDYGVLNAKYDFPEMPNFPESVYFFHSDIKNGIYPDVRAFIAGYASMTARVKSGQIEKPKDSFGRRAFELGEDLAKWHSVNRKLPGPSPTGKIEKVIHKTENRER